MDYLIATHGEFSKGILNSLHLILGDAKHIDVFCMTKSKSEEDAEKEAEAYLNTKKGGQLIVFTDVFGGSVANLFTTYLLRGYDFQLITGVNLPLLLSILLSDETDVHKLVKASIKEAKEGIQYVNEVMKVQRQNEEDIIE